MSNLSNNLPDDLNDLLSKKAKEMGVSKIEIVVRALRAYLEQLDRAAYVRSYKRASNDKDLLNYAEGGMEEYLRQLEE